MIEDQPNYQATDPQSWPPRRPQPSCSLRVLLLLQVAVINIGSHYNHHSLSSLSVQIMGMLDTNRTGYGFLFTSQLIPGIVLALFAGFLLVYIPHEPAAAFLTFLITVASALTSIAVLRESYALLVAGRFLFGLTEGALTTVQGAIIARRFKHHVGTGFGAMIFTSRLSSFAGLSLPSVFASNFGLGTAMWISTLITIPPMVAAITYAIAARRQTPTVDDEEDHTHHTGRLTPISVMRSLPRSFWTVCYIWAALAGVVFTALHFAPDALSARFTIPATVSSALSASLMLVAGLLSPVFGTLQDRMHNRAGILAGCSALVGIGTLCISFALKSEASQPGRVAAAVALVLMSLGWAAGPVTLMATLAVVVDPVAVSAALGLYKASESAALAVLHVVFGALRDTTKNYVWSFWLTTLLAATATFAALSLGTRLKRVADS